MTSPKLFLHKSFQMRWGVGKIVGTMSVQSVLKGRTADIARLPVPQNVFYLAFTLLVFFSVAQTTAVSDDQGLAEEIEVEQNCRN